MDFIKNILSGNSGIVLQVVSIMVIANGVLSAILMGLNSIKDKTETNIDNKIAKYLGMGLGYLVKILEFLQGNVEHK